MRQHELDTAERLAAHGYDVVFREESEQREADVLLDGVRWELKSPEGSGPQTIRNQLRRAQSQSERLVVDLARTSIPSDQAIADIRATRRGYPSFKRIIVMHMDGTLEEVPDGD